MAAEKNFELGDLVWAKMKQYPFWPAQIVNPPVLNEKALKGLPKKKLTSRKNQHYVFFFGTKNYAWILDESIVPHSEEMVNKEIKRKSGSYVKAVKEIIKASLGEDSVESDELSGSPEIHKKRGRRSKRKMKRGKTKKSTETLNLHPMTDTQQPFATNASNKELSPVQNLSRVSDDHSAPIASISNNIDMISDSFSNDSELECFPPLNYSGEEFRVTTSKKIGFLGLGMIGQRIVKKLLNSGHNVSVWNRTPEKCQDCVAAGAQQFSTPADVVCNCDIIFCCVSGSEAVKSIVFENCGVLHGLEKSEPGSKGYIELTSMNPVTLLEIYAAITDKGGKYLEAPISASIEDIVEGLSVIFVAGNRPLLIDCLSCFHAIAERICFMNCEVGTVSKTNIVISYLKAQTLANLAETMSLLDGTNLSQHSLMNILPSSPMASPFLLKKCQAMMQNNSTVDTSLKYLKKDLELGVQLINTYQQPFPMMFHVLALYQSASGRGYSEHDVSPVRYLAKLDVDRT
ncbi:putative oxidoreductase GLYR1 [Trichonephila clavipes]|nr:putative oxidoreductase GLYR1 [Trichonephila clavipes]